MGHVGLNPKLLGADEHVLRHLRTHPKVLLRPAAALLLEAVVLGVGFGLMPSSWWPAGQTLLVIALLAAFVASVLLPFLRWRARTYTITNRRIITRSGLLTKTGHDLPLQRINDVTYERSLLDRALGCGTLHLSTISEDPVTLHDVPDVERVHVLMTELLFGQQPQSDQH